jgi:hypothetical protein
VRVSDKGLGKTKEKLRSWGKLSTTKDPRARKIEIPIENDELLFLIAWINFSHFR